MTRSPISASVAKAASGDGARRIGACDSTTSQACPSTKRAAATTPSRCLAARSGRAGVRRGSNTVMTSSSRGRLCRNSRLPSSRQVLQLDDNEIAELLHVERALHGALDDHVAAVGGVTLARHQLELAHGVERPRDHRLGDVQLGRQSAHGVRRRLEINGEQYGELPRRQVRRLVEDQGLGEVMQQPQRLGWTQLEPHGELRKSFRHRIILLATGSQASRRNGAALRKVIVSAIDESAALRKVNALETNES